MRERNSEIRNNAENSNKQMGQTIAAPPLPFSPFPAFEFVSDLDIRISDLVILLRVASYVIAHINRWVSEPRLENLLQPVVVEEVNHGSECPIRVRALTTHLHGSCTSSRPSP